MSDKRCNYNLTTPPPWEAYTGQPAEGRNDDSPALWSGQNEHATPPEIGARVHVYMNGFGPATVTGYFIEYGFLGIHVRPDKRPKWHREQQPRRDVICVYGIDLTARDKVEWRS